MSNCQGITQKYMAFSGKFTRNGGLRGAGEGRICIYEKIIAKVS